MSTQQPMAAPRTTGEPRTRMIAALPVTERRLRLAGVDTAILEGGSGTPMVLLPGPNGSGLHFLRAIPALVEKHRVIAPDLPGLGESTHDEPIDIDGVLAWLDALIERTCPEPPVLVGCELGGAIAARYAAAHGDRITRLVLVDTLGLRPLEPAPEFGRALQAFLGAPNPDTYDELWRHCAYDLDALRARMGEDWVAFKDYNLDRAGSPRVRASLDSLLGQLGMPAIRTAVLERIDVPTTLVWGRHDLATPLSVAEQAADRYDWPLRIIEDCADDPPIEKPEAFVDALAS